MRSFAELGAATGAELVLEAIVPCVDQTGKPSADVAIMQRDMAAIAEAASAGGREIRAGRGLAGRRSGSTLPGSDVSAGAGLGRA